MTVEAERTLAEDWQAALGWWREAGVDLDFADAPERWVKPAEAETVTSPNPAPTAPPPPAKPRIGDDPAAWPADLAGFRTWWLAEPSLDDGRVEARVAPRGETACDLLVVVDQPESQDTETLLSGPFGRMIDGFARAAGVAPDRLGVISALPAHRPLPDWAALREAGLGAVLSRHVTLIGPKRIIALGSNVSSLLGHDPAQNDADSRRFNQDGQSIPLMTARAPEALARGSAKAALWRDWLNWTGTSTT